jgi:hypothetical protein
MQRMDAVPAATLAGGDITLGRKSSGPRATFPAAEELQLALSLNAPALARLKRGGALHGAVALNRIGFVRLHAVLQHGARRTPIGDMVLRVPEHGRTRFALALTSRGRAAVRRAGGGRVLVTARFRERGVAHTRRARRAVR